MIFKNLFRRKSRTLVTLLGISIGVAAIIILGAVARGLQTGFAAMTRGSQADLVLTQGGVLTSLLSSVDESVVDELRTWPEVAEANGTNLGNATLEGTSIIFLFGHEPQGFAVDHFRIIEGQSLAQAHSTRGKPLILGHRAAQGFDKQVGDSMRLADSLFRIVGIYETGDGFEDGGAVISIEAAQAITGQQHHVSMVYIKLRDPSDADRLRAKVERRFPDLALSTSSEFVDQEQMFEILEAVAMTISGLAVALGGIGMTNTLFMSVLERTREIGVLRSLGWRRRRVLALILGESLILSLLGGLAGIGLGVVTVFIVSRSSSWLGAFGTQFSTSLFVQALGTVIVLALVGGAYPAWWASRLLPVEALHYEGGGKATVPRFLPGFIARNLWRRRTRTLLTLLSIGVSIAAIVALGALAEGMADMMTQMWRSSQTDLFAIQAGVDSDYSALDERIGARINARADIEAVSGSIITAIDTKEMPFLLVFGYHPREFAIEHFRIVQGEPLTNRHQIIVGRQAAEQMGVEVGDTIRLLKSNFRVVGIYETGVSYEEIGVVIGLHEAQSLIGKPRQVMYFGIKLRDPQQAETVKTELQATFPEADFALTAEIAESMSDFQVMQEMVDGISFIAILIGGLGMLNTMLMSVLERTREIGVLRALGWRQRQVLWLILRESLALGIIGGIAGILLGLTLGGLIAQVPGMFGAIELVYGPTLFARAMVVALATGAIGGLYPAWRATRMRPVEALRYE